MKPLNFGKNEQNQDVIVDFEKKGIRFILLAGMRGSGKNHFQWHLYEDITRNHTPDEVGFILIKLALDPIAENRFRSTFIRYMVTPPVIEAAQAFGLLESEAIKRSKRAIIIHIEGCDLFHGDYARFMAILKQILEGKDDYKNIIVVYSTEHIYPSCIPDWIDKPMCVRVIFQTATNKESQLLLGNDYATKFAISGERMFVYGKHMIKCQPFPSSGVDMGNWFYTDFPLPENNQNDGDDEYQYPRYMPALDYDGYEYYEDVQDFDYLQNIYLDDYDEIEDNIFYPRDNDQDNETQSSETTAITENVSVKQESNSKLFSVLDAWRYDVATRFNVEKKRVLKDDDLRLISVSDPVSIDDLKRLGIPLAKRYTYSDVILDIIEKFESGEVKYYSDYVRITPTLKYRLDYDLLYHMLDAWRIDMASRLNVPKIAILPEYYLKSIVRIKPKTEQDLTSRTWLNKKWVAANQAVILDMVNKYLSGETRYYSDYVRKNSSTMDIHATKLYVMPPNQRKKEWDESESNQLIEKYRAGTPIAKLAAVHGRSELEVGLKLAQLLLKKEREVQENNDQIEKPDGFMLAFQRSGYKWTEEEDKALETEYTKGTSLEEIAKKHQRTMFALVYRVAYLGVDIGEILERIKKEQTM